MTRLLAFGDLHLGAGTDYGREPGDRLRDQQQVLEQIVQLANENEVDAVLFAGDAFHRRRPTPAELLTFARPLVELEAPLIAIAGNHDVESADLPTALEVFTNDAAHDSPGLLTLSTRPEVINLPGLAVCTLPWTPVSRLVAARDGGDRDRTHEEAAAMLIAAARGLRAEIPAGSPSVLLLHWSVSGASTPTGALTDDFREVVLDVDELDNLGFDCVIAGHIHRHQFPGGPDSRVFYTGSPLPIDFGEQSTPHGCVLITLGEDVFEGFEYEFVPIESRPFVTVEVDLTTDRHVDGEETAAIACAFSTHDITDAVARIRYRATEEQARRIDWPRLRTLLEPAHRVYSVQADIVRGDRSRVDGMDEELAPLEAVEAWIGANDLSETPAGPALHGLSARYLSEVGT